MFKGVVTHDVSVNRNADGSGERLYMKGIQFPSPVIFGYFCLVTAEAHGGCNDGTVSAQTVKKLTVHATVKSILLFEPTAFISSLVPTAEIAAKKKV